MFSNSPRKLYHFIVIFLTRHHLPACSTLSLIPAKFLPHTFLINKASAFIDNPLTLLASQKCGGFAEGLYGALKRRKILPYAYFYCISSITFISNPTFPMEMDFPLLHFCTTTIWFYSFHYYLPLCNHTDIPYRSLFPTISFFHMVSSRKSSFPKHFPYSFRLEIIISQWNYQVETRRFKTF